MAEAICSRMARTGNSMPAIKVTRHIETESMMQCKRNRDHCQYDQDAQYHQRPFPKSVQ